MRKLLSRVLLILFFAASYYLVWVFGDDHGYRSGLRATQCGIEGCK